MTITVDTGRLAKNVLKEINHKHNLGANDIYLITSQTKSDELDVVILYLIMRNPAFPIEKIHPLLHDFKNGADDEKKKVDQRSRMLYLLSQIVSSPQYSFSEIEKAFFQYLHFTEDETVLLFEILKRKDCSYECTKRIFESVPKKIQAQLYRLLWKNEKTHDALEPNFFIDNFGSVLNDDPEKNDKEFIHEILVLLETDEAYGLMKKYYFIEKPRFTYYFFPRDIEKLIAEPRMSTKHALELVRGTVSISDPQTSKLIEYVEKNKC